MLDILGAMTLAAIAILLVGSLTLVATRRGPKRAAPVLLGGAWFVGVASLAASGIFARPGGLGALAVGAAVVTPVLAAVVLIARSRSAHSFALGIPPAVLVGLHTGRFFGIFFVLLHAAGRLPPTFALMAGWGDILVAATAAPLAWAVHRRVAGWWRLTLLWNVVATIDLMTAVALGVGSAPDSPLRFIFESPASGAIATLPWVMIPGFLVPLYLLAHVAIFAQLAATARSEPRVSLHRAA